MLGRIHSHPGPYAAHGPQVGHPREVDCFTLGIYLFIFKDFIYLFLERGEGREKERERNVNVWLILTFSLLGTWPATQAYALNGN